MAYLNPVNPFQSWVLSNKETLQGQVLTTLQKQVIQNEIASLANQRISIDFDPEHPMFFQQLEAGLKGKIGILCYLLEMSNVAETALNDGRNPQNHIHSQEN